MTTKIHTVTILDETVTFTLSELSQSCDVPADLIIDMVELGLLEPTGKSPDEWHFTSAQLRRSKTAIRLREDLGINLPGAALALDLLDELQELRQQINLLEHQLRRHL